jgi:hypothetical protein
MLTLGRTPTAAQKVLAVTGADIFVPFSAPVTAETPEAAQ